MEPPRSRAAGRPRRRQRPGRASAAEHRPDAVDLVLTGQHHCADGASFTLTSGIFADQAWPHVTGGGVISGALHSFALSAAIELPRGMRINVVSPTMIGDSVATFDEHFPGMRPVPMDELVDHYLRCVEGDDTGSVIRAYG